MSVVMFLRLQSLGPLSGFVSESSDVSSILRCSSFRIPVCMLCMYGSSALEHCHSH